MGSQAEFALCKAIKELTAANERIRELEAAVSDWLQANGPDGWIEALRKDVESERAISGKLEKALQCYAPKSAYKIGSQWLGHSDGCTIDVTEVSGVALDALTEVAAMRKGGEHDR